jgi:hypothetical protein
MDSPSLSEGLKTTWAEADTPWGFNLVRTSNLTMNSEESELSLWFLRFPTPTCVASRDS